ncbi:MAG: 4-hydroxy-tetrahydrodipicolinate reductase [Candidatus Woesearchaeota archaeon]|nr:4-hydroxy-tetrahydrodipicolinate reductase [Candidatus Woesearchaeota archaeon]
MNIALIGYGKMGNIIERIARARGHTIKAIIDPNIKGNGVHSEITEAALKDIDVCLDFTHPSVVIENIEKAAKLGKNIVVGTTGWYDQLDDVKNAVKKSNVGLIYSGNFSIGVNIFLKIIENAAKLINNAPEYDIFAYELHHNQKADSPSGTAKMIGDILIKNIERKNKIATERLDRKISQDEIHFASVRGGTIPGTHVIGFDSAADTIELTHTARNREGFALGAVMAAEFIKGKKGVYGIDDLMKNIMK